MHKKHALHIMGNSNFVHKLILAAGWTQACIVEGQDIEATLSPALGSAHPVQSNPQQNKLQNTGTWFFLFLFLWIPLVGTGALVRGIVSDVPSCGREIRKPGYDYNNRPHQGMCFGKRTFIIWNFINSFFSVWLVCKYAWATLRLACLYGV